MKKIIFSMIVCCMTLVSSAQISFNVKAGVGISSFLGSDPAASVSISTGETHDLNFSIKEAWRIGVGMEYNFCKSWSFAPSLNFTAAGAQTEEFKVGYLVGGKLYTHEVDATLYYIQVPLDLQWKTSISEITTLGIYAGPYLGYGVGGKTKAKWAEFIPNIIQEENNNNSFGDKDGQAGFKHFDFGLNCGVNFDIDHYIVGADFGFGLIKNHKESKGMNFTGMVTFGYRF